MPDLSLVFANETNMVSSSLIMIFSLYRFILQDACEERMNLP